MRHFRKNGKPEMSHVVSLERLRIWKLMEFVGILPNKKRRVLISELERKSQVTRLESDERKILTADKMHPQDKRARRRFLKQELKAWEKRTAI